MRSRLPYFLAFLTACDPSLLAFQAVPLDAGFHPVGGGGIDKRLAGCTLTKTHAFDFDAEELRYRSKATYDLWGRRTAYEAHFSNEYFDDSLEYAETWVFDPSGCPVSGEVAYLDDVWELHEAPVVRTCDEHGHLTEWRAGSSDTRYRNEYGPLGKLVARELLYDNSEDVALREEFTWAGDRVTEWVERDVEDGEEDGRESRTYNLDGWITSEDLEGYPGTYRYDLAGRLVEATGWMGAVYSYASPLAAFPATVTYNEGTGTIRVDCWP